MLVTLLQLLPQGEGVAFKQPGVWDLIFQSGLFAKAILLALLLLSILTWAITLLKYQQFRRFHTNFGYFINMVRPHIDISTLYNNAIQMRTDVFSPIVEEGYYTLSAALKQDLQSDGSRDQGYRATTAPAAVLRTADHVFEHELQTRLESATNSEISQLANGLPLLSTAVTVSPFIGLLGTVWGILQAFLNIGFTGSAELAVVAPGIAEALITTVAGLLVAIPAVLCNNFLASRLQGIEDSLERLVTELNIYYTKIWYHEKAKIESRLGS